MQMMTNYRAETTPHLMRRLRKIVKDARARYVDERRAALAACAAYRQDRTGRNKLAAEDAVAEAADARRWYYIELANLRRFERFPCVKGSAMCPAARERAIVSGRMRP